MKGFGKIWHRPTLPSHTYGTVPPIAIGAALAGLTSLFGPDSYREGRGGHRRYKTRKPHDFSRGFLIRHLGGHSKIWHRPTLPHFTAVPSALAGLTSLFGMGRGGHRRYRHLNIFSEW